MILRGYGGGGQNGTKPIGDAVVQVLGTPEVVTKFFCHNTATAAAAKGTCPQRREQVCLLVIIFV